MRPSAQHFLWKWVLFAWEWKVIFLSKAEHLTSSRYRGPEELRNGHITIFFCKKEDHRSYRRNFCSGEKKAWKKLGLHRIRTLDVCDTAAALYQLSKEANWEQVIELVRYRPVKGWWWSFESLTHLFYHCSRSKQFWMEFELYWCLISNQRIRLCLENVLFGILTENTCPLLQLLNYFIIIGKLYLWDCRSKQILPNIYGFRAKIIAKYETEEKISNKEFFIRKWILTPYLR